MTDNTSNHRGDGCSIRQYLHPDRTRQSSCIIVLLNTSHVEIKSKIVQPTTKFHDFENESPYLHHREFRETCTAINLQNIFKEQKKLELFPLRSSEDMAHLHSKSIGQWDKM